MKFLFIKHFSVAALVWLIRESNDASVRLLTVYNGHKRVHALKFQSVALLNGIIANMYGPVGEYYILTNFNQYLKS